MSQPRIVLASGSRYRRQLLSRLLEDFDTAAPDVDESRGPREPPAELALRLARAKAEAGAAAAPDAIVIGSDQVAAIGDRVLGKPGDRERAIEQLRACSGARVDFYTAVCVTAAGGRPSAMHTDLTTAQFRELDDAELERYLDKEPALDCAGSFKSEGLGIALMQRIDCEDPTALQGLPLIWLAGALRRAGLDLP